MSVFVKVNARLVFIKNTICFKINKWIFSFNEAINNLLAYVITYGLEYGIVAYFRIAYRCHIDSLF